MTQQVQAVPVQKKAWRLCTVTLATEMECYKSGN